MCILKNKKQKKDINYLCDVIQKHMKERFGDTHCSWTLLTEETGVIKHKYLFIVSELYDVNNRYVFSTDNFEDLLYYIDKNDFENGRDDNGNSN